MAAPYGDGKYAQEPPPGNGLNISEIFHIVDEKPNDPIIGSAIDSQYPHVAIITFDKRNQFGGMWAKEKLDLTLPFSTRMALYLEREYGGIGSAADGMTFTLHNDPAGINAIGGAGEGLGVYRGRKFVGYMPSGDPQTEIHGTYLRNSLVVEFDTYRNTDTIVSDPSVTAPHTAHCSTLLPRAISITATDHKHNFGFTKRQEWIEFEVSWIPNDSGGGILSYTFDGVSRQVSVNDILATFNDTKVYWGFTGATGELTSVQAAAIVVLPRQGILVEKTVKNSAGDDIDHGVVSRGDTVIYTIRVTALSDTNGPFNIEDDISEFLDFPSAGEVILTTSAGGPYLIPYTMSGTTMSVYVNQSVVNKDDWFEITFEAKVSDDAGGKTILNSATVSTAELSEKSNETDVSVFSEPVKSVSGLSEAGQNGSAVKVGDLITYNISYGNDGDTAEDIIITDMLPDGVSFESASLPGSYDGGTNTVTWELPDVEPGVSDFVSLVVRVNETAVVTIENEAIVRIGQNQAHTNRVVNPVAPEGPEKVIYPGTIPGQDGAPVKLGDNVTYGITYLNHLADAATITIIDELPKGVDFLNASDGGRYDAASHTVTWTLNGVPSGRGGMVSLTVRVNEDAVVKIENKATVQVEDEDPLTTNPVVNPVTPENPVKTISASSKAGQRGGAVKEGDRISYDITYLNYQETAATVIITDELSTGVDFVSASNGGVYDEAAHTVTWTLDNVPSGGSGKVSLVVQVNETAAVRVENSATVQVGDGDPLPTNIVVNPLIEFRCPKIKRVCRITIEGCKIWADNDNAEDTRPPSVEIVLLRDGEVYRRKTIDSTGDGKFIFACLPVWKNSEDRYSYRVDELEVPDNYVKRIEGYNVINTLAT